VDLRFEHSVNHIRHACKLQLQSKSSALGSQPGRQIAHYLYEASLMRTPRLPRKARPILWRRDYEAAQKVLAEVADDERFLALLQELKEYERRHPAADLRRVVQWAEYVFVPMLVAGVANARRWSDRQAA
jgi:hypothetical protein